jgi:hypothetical protein
MGVVVAFVAFVIVALVVMAVMLVAFMVRDLFDVGRHFSKGTQDVVDELTIQATRCVRPARKQTSAYGR